MANPVSWIFRKLFEGSKGITILSVLSVGGLFGYVYVREEMVLPHYPPFYDALALVVLSLVTMFILGCYLHTLLIGETSVREFRNIVEEESQKLSDFNRKVANQLESLELQASSELSALRPSLRYDLVMGRRIVAALERRDEQIRVLLETKSSNCINEAYDILHSSLEVDNNCHDGLITGEPIPPIQLEELVPKLKQLFQRIAQEIKYAEDTKRRMEEEVMAQRAAKMKRSTPRRRRTMTCHGGMNLTKLLESAGVDPEKIEDLH